MNQFHCFRTWGRNTFHNKWTSVSKNDLSIHPQEIRIATLGLPGPKKLKRPNLAISSFKKAKFSKKIYQNISKKNLKYPKVLYILLTFSQNRLKKILFSSRFKKGQEKAKWQNHFISRKLFQKGQMATLRDVASKLCKRFKFKFHFAKRCRVIDKVLCSIVFLYVLKIAKWTTNSRYSKNDKNSNFKPNCQ